MLDVWVMLGVMVLAMAACVAGAAIVARRLNRAVAVVVAGVIAASMLLAGKYLSSDSVWVAGVVSPRLLPVFGNWLPLMAGLLVGVSWVLSERSRPAKAAVLGLLLVAAMYLPYRPLFEARPEVRNRWTRSGVCLQTTSATCGAAAAATLLNTVGVDTSEHEMVELCFSTSKGTSLHGMLRGISRKLEGTNWRARATVLDKGQLAQLDGAAILVVGLSEEGPGTWRYTRDWGWIPGVEHAVVLFDGRGQRFDIGDPSTGRELWKTETLDVLWRGVAIVLEPC